jgi:hypothetical protein
LQKYTKATRDFALHSPASSSTFKGAPRSHAANAEFQAKLTFR